jgi:hypothetical protein
VVVEEEEENAKVNLTNEEADEIVEDDEPESESESESQDEDPTCQHKPYLQVSQNLTYLKVAHLIFSTTIHYMKHTRYNVSQRPKPLSQISLEKLYPAVIEGIGNGIV